MKAGKITISEASILQWLQFPLANILETKFNVGSRTFEIILEDEEMSEVGEGEYIKDVIVSYITYQDPSGNKVQIRESLNK